MARNFTAVECERLSLLAQKYFVVPHAHVTPSGDIWVNGGGGQRDAAARSGARNRFHAWVARTRSAGPENSDPGSVG